MGGHAAGLDRRAGAHRRLELHRPHSLIEANTRLGRGTIVCAGSFVRGDFPDFAVLDGHPARVVGDSRRADEKWLARHPELRAHYDAWAKPPP